MLHGLMWFPLLFLFIGLAWAGWNEFQKVEAYRTWAEQFERAKYDIYAALGQQGDQLTWGKPTRRGVVDLQTFSLKDVRSLQLLVNEQPVSMDSPPEKGRDVALEFRLEGETVKIPFTEVSLAAQWGRFLQQQVQLEVQPKEA